MDQPQLSIFERMSNQIDFWLGGLSHGEIVIASYLISAIVIFILIAYIVLDGKKQKRKLTNIEALGARRRSKPKGETQ